jgi:hypothetical protein
LEAEWAAILLHYFTKIQYEHFHAPLACGGYVPDFFIPALDSFFEVKASKPWNEDWWIKASELAYRSGKRVLVSFGHYRGHDIHAFYCCGSDEPYNICTCPRCGRAGIEFNGRAERIKCLCTEAEKGHKEYRPVADADLAKIVRRARFSIASPEEITTMQNRRAPHVLQSLRNSMECLHCKNEFLIVEDTFSTAFPNFCPRCVHLFDDKSTKK